MVLIRQLLCRLRLLMIKIRSSGCTSDLALKDGIIVACHLVLVIDGTRLHNRLLLGNLRLVLLEAISG